MYKKNRQFSSLDTNTKSFYPPFYVTFCLFAGLLLLTGGCAVKSDKGPYPPPEKLQAVNQMQQSFVKSFLEGRWCEAELEHRETVRTFLRKDDFCGAAMTVLAAWKLKSYVDIEDSSLLDWASQLSKTGISCPEVTKALQDPGRSKKDPRDREYGRLIEENRFEVLLSELASEEDPLFASVYARKGAYAALQRNRTHEAGQLITFARDLDGSRGWVIFVMEDWKILAEMETDMDRKEKIKFRLKKLEQLIQPCEKVFDKEK